ncbi:MAG TPA: PfkB family carbohydrate kinase [Planctomycetota bacterium]|nr:PfkB family carbohydrate kinase [Planctomycetota bacterium]
MSLLVVGSVAFDTVETPFGRAERVLGGSATFFAFAASYFCKQRLVGIVGNDFPRAILDEFGTRGIDIAGLTISRDGKTFHWTGKYEGDMNAAQTLGVSLNVLGEYKAAVPEAFRDSPYVFLANDHPQTQLDVLAAVKGEPFSVADTRDFWISEEPKLLEKVLGAVDGLVLNEHEARLLTGEKNLVRAGMDIMKRGPEFAVIKKGEHGSLLFSSEGTFALPAYPLFDVRDPTGAGDAFAGGLMGYLAASGQRSLEAVRRGLTWGTVCASVAVQDFSVEPFRRVTREQLNTRHDAFMHAIRF